MESRSAGCWNFSVSTALKILFVASHWPLGASYGAQQRVLNIARLLSRFGDVSFVIVDPERADEEVVYRTKREFEVRRTFRPFSAPMLKPTDRVLHRCRYEFDPRYLWVPFTVTDTDRDALLDLIQQHDVVWVHTIKTANLFRISRWPHSVLDVDDLLSRYYRSTAQSGGSLVRRFLDLRLSWQWRRREQLFTERFDVVTVCSGDDRQYLGNQAKVHVIPNGFNPPAIRPRAPSDWCRIGFIGLLPYPPNRDGVTWFIRRVWPLIKRDVPRAELRLVGRGSDSHFTKLGPDIVGLGWLEDPGDEIATWSGMIVPIRSGGGTRIKVAEGFARRCPVVATTMGAFGYDLQNGEEILLGDEPRDFASACIRLLNNPQVGETISQKAYECFLERWTWDSYETVVGKVIQECLARSIRTHAGQGEAGVLTSDCQ
jgi:glycosyltransferase involved in cell wall biosynthesis